MFKSNHNIIFHCRLVSRLAVGDSKCYIEPVSLYENYKFEAIESNSIVASSKQFGECVTKLFKVKSEPRKIGGKSIRQYKGLRLLPLEPLPRSVLGPATIDDISHFICPSFHFSSKESTHVSYTFTSQYEVNGHPVQKTVTFENDYTFHVKVGTNNIDLKELGVLNKYQLNKTSLQNICKIVKMMEMCYGVEVKSNTICSRFHTLELITEGETKLRILRSLMCKKIVKFNSRSKTCRNCQTMTISTKDSKEKENKENSTINQQSSNFTFDNIQTFMPSATKEMIEFIKCQVKNANKHPKGRSWSQEVINVCLQLFTKSPAGYQMLRDSNMVVLPSPSLLLMYKTKIQHKVGFQDNIFRWMHAEAKRLKIPTNGYYGGVILDEMAIQSDIQIAKNGSVIELCGFVDVGPDGKACQTLRAGRSEQQLGTHVLQFIFLGHTGFRFPFAHFITHNVAAYDIDRLFWDAVVSLSMYGFTTDYTCMDGAQNNRTFLNINLEDAKQSMLAKSPECPDDSVVFMMDISHVFKKIRNNVLKSGLSKGCTRDIKLPNNTPIQWQMWVDAFNWDQKNALQLHRKLTNEHIFPSTQNKMRNHLAEQVLNSDMLNLMSQYQSSLSNGIILDGVLQFLTHTSKLLDIFHDPKPVQTLDDKRLKEVSEIHKWFLDWTEATNSQKLTAGEKSRRLMSSQCRDDLHSSLLGFCELCEKVLKRDKSVLGYITPSLINSDIVENHFCQQRATYNGANTNPTALQYRRNQNAIILGQGIISTKANAGKPHMAAHSYLFEQDAKKRKSDNKSETPFKKIKLVRM